MTGSRILQTILLGRRFAINQRRLLLTLVSGGLAARLRVLICCILMFLSIYVCSSYTVLHDLQPSDLRQHAKLCIQAENAFPDSRRVEAYSAEGTAPSKESNS